jgi:glyoxylase-like metal-dependent hydrolase (beta-lactamase superfamily II)
MLTAAFTSACAACPHAVQANSAWVRRLSFAQCPQRAQVREVSRGADGFTWQDAVDAQLRRLGHRPADVTHVVYSHLHLDHAGGMSSFPHAVHVVQHAVGHGFSVAPM